MNRWLDLDDDLMDDNDEWMNEWINDDDDDQIKLSMSCFIYIMIINQNSYPNYDVCVWQIIQPQNDYWFLLIIWWAWD